MAKADTQQLVGTVTRGHGNRFIVFAAGRFFDCQLRKKVKFKTDKSTPVAVGDDVEITVASDSDGVIEAVGARRSVLSRPVVGRETIEHVMAANIDCLAIIVSAAEPPYKPGLIDRFLITAEIGGLRPLIVVNKTDLDPPPEIAESMATYRKLGYDLIATSAVAQSGLPELRRYLKDHRTIFSGHSGVGKTSLLNILLPGRNLKTMEISDSTGKGQHATSYVEMFPLPGGGFVIDSPGIKELGLWQIDKERLDEHYPEMLEIRNNCRFTGCRHLTEPDCAVKAAVEAGTIAAWRYQNYQQIYGSL